MKRAATLALAPLSILYGAAMKAREAAYRNGVFRTHRVDAPVISVGNITTGGTGKTPVVEWIARELARHHRVCILTRGYGRANQDQRVVVSDGKQILSDVDESGDEPFMLAESLKSRAAVVCDADRVSAAIWAIQNLLSDVLILDDGFQNLRIARELNIVTIDATNPWGNNGLLPAGRLREPIESLQRAGCIILSRTNGAVEADLLNQIRDVTDATILKSRMVTSRIRALNVASPATEIESIRAMKLAAFCAIGNSQAFFNHLRAVNVDLMYTSGFRDHHRYSQADVDRIVREAAEAGAEGLITTAKDEVKLRSLRIDLPCYVVDIAIEIDEQDKLLALLEAATRPGSAM
jgi:tetraacyldisaccharide 4'-kinase